jgi:uncharacterized Zn-finger protein
MMDATYRTLLRQIELAGSCTHPVRLSGEMVNLASGEVGRKMLSVACRDRREQICPACSHLYKTDAWILVSAGLIGGKGVPESVFDHPRVFATLTAPSFGSVHVRRGNGTCHEMARGWCQHGVQKSCQLHHAEGSPVLGTPLCVSCFDYEGAVAWNAHASRLWNRTVEQIRYDLASDRGISVPQFRREARISYLKVAEYQRRGLIHFHIILRVDGPGEAFSQPPSWIDVNRLHSGLIDVIANFDMVGLDGETRHWGSQFDIKHLDDDRDDLRVASYVAKYATKSTGDSIALARRFRSRREIEQLGVDPHLRRMVVTAWDLAKRPHFESLNLRHHAHAIGFTGQLITKSRHFSTTFQDLRGIRREHMAQFNESDPVSGTFTYIGRGYDDPRASGVAELVHRARTEARRVAREQRVMSRGISEGGSL